MASRKKFGNKSLANAVILHPLMSCLMRGLIGKAQGQSSSRSMNLLIPLITNTGVNS